MYTGLKHLHSFTAYLTLALLIIAVVYAIYAWISNKPFTKRSHTIRLWALIGTHTQIILGLILYFISPYGLANFSGENMKDGLARLYMLEHPFTMLIAVTVITIGYTRSKKAVGDKSKFKSLAIFFGIGLVLILSRIPWQAWLSM